MNLLWYGASWLGGARRSAGRSGRGCQHIAPDWSTGYAGRPPSGQMITKTSCCQVVSLDPMCSIVGATPDSEGESLGTEVPRRRRSINRCQRAMREPQGHAASVAFRVLSSCGRASGHALPSASDDEQGGCPGAGNRSERSEPSDRANRAPEGRRSESGDVLRPRRARATSDPPRACERYSLKGRWVLTSLLILVCLVAGCSKDRQEPGLFGQPVTQDTTAPPIHRAAPEERQVQTPSSQLLARRSGPLRMASASPSGLLSTPFAVSRAGRCSIGQ